MSSVSGLRLNSCCQNFVNKEVWWLHILEGNISAEIVIHCGWHFDLVCTCQQTTEVEYILKHRKWNMFVKFFNYFVFHLSSFPNFTTDNVIGRLFVCFILLMKRLFMFWRLHKNKQHQNFVSPTKIIEVIKKLISDNRSPLYRVSHFQFGNFESLYFEKYLT